MAFPGEMNEETEEQRISAASSSFSFSELSLQRISFCVTYRLTLPPYNYTAVRNSAEGKYNGVEIVFFNMQIDDFFMKGL